MAKTRPTAPPKLGGRPVVLGQRPKTPVAVAPTKGTIYLPQKVRPRATRA